MTKYFWPKSTARASPTLLRQRSGPSTSENFKAIMSLKINRRSISGKISPITLQPPVLHDVSTQAALAKPASRRPLIATQPASGTANHARHHVSRRTQS